MKSLKYDSSCKSLAKSGDGADENIFPTGAGDKGNKNTTSLGEVGKAGNVNKADKENLPSRLVTIVNLL